MEIKGYTMPEDLYYEERHYWVRVEGEIIVMGMDDFGQQLAGEIVYVQLPLEGKTLKKGKKFAQVESGKWLGKVYAPVNGKLLEANEKLESSPMLINEDCYGEGWMFKIQPNDMAEVEQLFYGRPEVEKWLRDDIAKYNSD